MADDVKPYVRDTTTTGYSPASFGNKGVGNLNLSAHPSPSVEHIAHTDTTTDAGPDHIIATSVGNFFSSTSIYLEHYGNEGTQDDPLHSWNGVIEFVNYRLNGNYSILSDGSFLIPSSFGYAPPLPLVGPKHKLSKQDIIEVRDRLRLLNPWMQFSPIPRIWKESMILEMLKICWVQQITTRTISDSFRQITTTEFLGTNPHTITSTSGQDNTVNTKSELITEGPPGDGFAKYVIDMGNGLGPQDYTWPSEGFPSGQELLDRWAQEDRFEDEQPTPRGSLIDFKVTPPNGTITSTSSQVNFDITVSNFDGPVFHTLQTSYNTQSTTTTRTWKLYGDFPSYMVGGTL